MNVHKDCKYYVGQNDLCLCYFELTNLAFNVSQNTNECLERVIYNDKGD